MKVLISGAASGLGRYLQRQFQGHSLTRNNSIDELKKNKYDVIIHCASNPRAVTRGFELSRYIEDNFLLTQRLLEIEHRKFVFISTVDVYPKESNTSEELDIDLDDLQGGYPITKLMSESLVMSCGSEPLILRPTSMLGIDMRPNSLFKMFTSPACHITLSESSIFNYVLHEDIGSFIEYCLVEGIEGVYNVASQGNIELKDLVDYYGLRHVTFGTYNYNVGVIDTTKIIDEYPLFDKSTRYVVSNFIEMLRRIYEE